MGEDIPKKKLTRKKVPAPEVVPITEPAANIKQNNKAREVQSQTQALIGTVSEFLGSYILIGYDMVGEPVAFSYAKTPLETDALSTLLIKYVNFRGASMMGQSDE